MRYFSLLAVVLLASCSAKRYEPRQGFIDSLSRDTFEYFWETADSVSGHIPDRFPTKSFSSIAATGFGLTSYLIGVERQYITRDEAANRVLKTLKSFAAGKQGTEFSGVMGYKGFFYHFIDMRTGHRYQDVELSTIDTGLLMMGVLSCQTYFDQSNPVEGEIRALADSLYRSVEWDWAMYGRGTMTMGWRPTTGFMNDTWRGYNEAMLLYVLGLGSPTHAIADSSWTAWTRNYQWANYYGREFVNFGPLFGHQYSHVWIDFRGIQDPYMAARKMDYAENTRRATLSNRDYCIANPGHFNGYGPDQWGLTACDGPGNEWKINPNISFKGYHARGVSQFYLEDDGTIAPTAAGGSIPFAPDECLRALTWMKDHYHKDLYGRYGFRDAFNLSIERRGYEPGWFDPDYLGIDQGPILIQLENYRTEMIWNLMKKNPYIVTGLKRAGFKGGWLDNPAK